MRKFQDYYSFSKTSYSRQFLRSRSEWPRDKGLKAISGKLCYKNIIMCSILVCVVVIKYNDYARQTIEGRCVCFVSYQGTNIRGDTIYSYFCGAEQHQHVALSITCVRKFFLATSKQGRRRRFGMSTVLTNIRSTKVLW